jgi:hypothetical protein
MGDQARAFLYIAGTVLFDPWCSAIPNMNTKRLAERHVFMSACNHFLTLLTVVVICRQPSSLNFPRSFLGRAWHINYHCRPESRRNTIHWARRLGRVYPLKASRMSLYDTTRS